MMSTLSLEVSTDLVGFCLLSLDALVLMYWFCCLANPKDLIEVKFDMRDMDAARGLKSYMNTLINTNNDVIAF